MGLFSVGGIRFLGVGELMGVGKEILGRRRDIVFGR